ncbi:MAG: NAD+ synthase [Bacteroidetes bacterium]|nr:NAD+ synthase [Bacteroidota bacterium]
MLPQLKLDTTATADHLIDFIRSEFRDAGFTKAVIGLSGGVDSALSTVLAARAIGADNVLCLMMPHTESNPDSLAHAKLLVEELGVRYDVIDITPMVDVTISTDPEMDLLRRGNIMARQRMILLYDRSSREHALVVGTGNKTELLLGYSTLYGDAACAIDPLGDLYKTQVWQLAADLGVPDVIVRKAPSADLWAGQTDEGELGFTYRSVDEVLVHLVDERRDDEALRALGFEQDFLSAVREMIRRNRFKRMLPRVPRIGSRPVNADVHFPREWGV